MKKSILILFLIMSSFAMNSQTLEWHTDVKKASDISMKTNKPLMLFFTGSDWCGWCIRLQKEVFLTPEFTTWAKENVVLVELDFPRKKVIDAAIKQQNTELEQMFAVRGYPTVWMVKPTKKDAQVSFERLGSTGYVAGGPAAWIQGANSIIKK